MSIYVFGSNLAGIHGAGFARVALNYGAKWGVGEGPSGLTYAIPTKDTNLKTRALLAIALSVKKFIKYAKANPKETFVIKNVGCGLAGYSAKDIAPLFRDAPDNCLFPEEWLPYLGGEDGL